MRWLVLTAACATLSGCMASALDPSAIRMPAPGQSFSFADDGVGEPPRPAADLVTGSTEELALVAETEEPRAAMAALAPTPDNYPAPQLSTTVNDSATEILPDAGSPDLATARINAAAAPQQVPAPRPPVSGLATRAGNLLGLFSGNRQANARKALVPLADTPRADTGAELWSAPSASAKNVGRPVIANAKAPGLPGVDRERALGPNAQPPDDGDEQPVRVASAAGLARLAPNGLRIQHDGVDVKCLKPALVRVLDKVKRHYGREVVVTSGYRSPTRNKAAQGSSNSLHMYCSAADIQIEGVSKWQLAEYLRSMPGRGGVGTYCYTESVHIDIGPERDWNWRCARKK